MIKKNDLEKIDSSKMFRTYDLWPEIAKENFYKENKKINLKKPSHIIFAGMGGSGTINDVFGAIFSKTDIHVEIVKGYLLPNTVNKKTLVITTSVSGNTVETLNILKQAKKIGCNIIAFSSGGKMKVYCERKSIKFLEISMHHSPRASFTAFLFRMLRELQNILPIKNQDILMAIKELENTRKNIYSDNLTNSNNAIKLAKWIKDIPVIYFPWGLQSSAIRFKNSLQENSKIHVIAEDVIEASHNGIVAWKKNSNVQPILIEGQDDFIKTKERWKILKQFFDDNKIKYKEINSIEGNILAKLVQLIYFFDYVSIYLAIIRKTDPTPVMPIEYIKKKLK